MSACARRRPSFSVRYRADGHDFHRPFEQKGWAEAFAGQLRAGFAQGWPFDSVGRRFVDPATAGEPEPVTVFLHACDYVARKWRGWQPATRPNAQRDLARACLSLVRNTAPRLSRDARAEADAFLREVALAVPAPEVLSETQRSWEEWFRRWSLPLAEVTDRDLLAFMEDVRTRTLYGRRRELAPSSAARTRAVVRAAFTYARKRRLIQWDPWEPVEAPKVQDRDSVDADLVMSPEQVRALARACGAIHARYEAFVLIQGFCGLRPGEAIELRRRDIDLLAGEPVAVTAGGTRAHVPDRYLMEGESRRRPLKGRGERARRTIPLPAELVPLLTRHLAAFTPPARNAHLFTTPSGARLNLSNFQRDAWRPARNAVFEKGDPLRGVRRHDLRHAAITAWLNAGVPLKTAQAWSGHRSASVLLNTYLGVIAGDEDVAMARYEASCNGRRIQMHRSRDTLVTRPLESKGKERYPTVGTGVTAGVPVAAGQRRISGFCAGEGPGAGTGNRTPDLFITSESLCRLSYPGATARVASQSARCEPHDASSSGRRGSRVKLLRATAGTSWTSSSTASRSGRTCAAGSVRPHASQRTDGTSSAMRRPAG